MLRLGLLVDDLHLLAMADLQALPCHFADMDAVQVVRGVMRRHARLAADAGLTLGWGSEPAGPVAVRWDAARIEQLLANLLQNSLRYTDAPGRIELSLQHAQGRVQTRRRRQCARRARRTTCRASSSRCTVPTRRAAGTTAAAAWAWPSAAAIVDRAWRAHRRRRVGAGRPARAGRTARLRGGALNVSMSMNMNATAAAPVLVVEDDPKIAQLLLDYLRAEGLPAQAVADGAEAVRQVDARAALR